jgi:hypothetical protein
LNKLRKEDELIKSKEEPFKMNRFKNIQSKISTRRSSLDNSQSNQYMDMDMDMNMNQYEGMNRNSLNPSYSNQYDTQMNSAGPARSHIKGIPSLSLNRPSSLSVEDSQFPDSSTSYSSSVSPSQYEYEQTHANADEQANIDSGRMRQMQYDDESIHNMAPSSYPAQSSHSLSSKSSPFYAEYEKENQKSNTSLPLSHSKNPTLSSNRASLSTNSSRSTLSSRHSSLSTNSTGEPVFKHSNYGKVPVYLQEYKEELAANKAEKERVKKEKDMGIPDGMILMPEEQRLQTLQILNESKYMIEILANYMNIRGL